MTLQAKEAIVSLRNAGSPGYETAFVHYYDALGGCFACYSLEDERKTGDAMEDASIIADQVANDWWDATGFERRSEYLICLEWDWWEYRTITEQ